MHYAPTPDMHPVAEVRSPAGLGAYRQGVALGRIETVRGPETNSPYVVMFKHGSFGDMAQFDLMTGMMAWKQASANEQWRRLVLDPRAAAHVDALTQTVEAGLDFIAEFGPGSLSLAGLDQASVQCEHLAALLRATSTWRDSIPGWNEALNVARAAVDSAGLDPEDVLFGMV